MKKNKQRKFLSHLEDKEVRDKTAEEKNLDSLRLDIDNIDYQIFELFEQRMKKVEEVWFLKNKLGKSVLDQRRKQEALDKRIWFWQMLWIYDEESTSLYKTLHDLAVNRRNWINYPEKRQG